ncbi:PA2c domain-containing protein, partial [Meloidogyne graminicola]
GNKYKYEECPINNPTCGNVKNLLEYVTKCIGLVICYQSLLTNPDVFDNLKFHHEHEIPPGNGPRLCAKCIEMGQCKGSINGKKLEWNGVKIYFYENTQTLEIETDLIGNRFIQNIIDTTPLKFLQLISKGNQQLLTLKNDKESNSALNGLNLDLFVWLERYDPLKTEGRKVYLGLHDTEECEEEEMEIIAQTHPSCSYYTNGPSFFDKYSCHCGSTNETSAQITKCCTEHHLCLKNLTVKCQSTPTIKHYIDIDTTKYEHNNALFEKDNKLQCMAQPVCDQELCECDRAVIECWSGLHIPPVDKICQACYRDEGRKLVNKTLKKLKGLRDEFGIHEVNVLNITENIIKNKIDWDAKEVNSTILDASFNVKSNFPVVAESEADIFIIIDNIQDLISQDINLANIYANKNYKNTAKTYMNAAHYKHLVNEMASSEYYKEKFMTYKAGEFVLQKLERLSKIINEKSKEDF